MDTSTALMAGIRTYGLSPLIKMPTCRPFPGRETQWSWRGSFPITAAGQSRSYTGFPFMMPRTTLIVRKAPVLKRIIREIMI